MLISVRSQGELLETNPQDLEPIKARRVFIRLRQNTLQLAAGSFIREALVRRKFFDGVFVL